MTHAGTRLEITYRDPKELIPYKNNARIHSDKQIAEIMASMGEFGFTAPILLGAANNILAGHGRLMAAIRLHLNEVPTIHLTQLSDSQQRAYILADNKLSLNASWDEELLSIEIQALNDIDFDVSLTGFGTDEIDDIFGNTRKGGLTDDDATPKVLDEAVTLPGDVWTMGKHKLICGDALAGDTLGSLMFGFRVDMVFTDPPYNANYSSRVDVNRREPWGGILNDKMSKTDFDTFLQRTMDTLNTYLKDQASIYCCIDWKHYGQLAEKFGETFNHKATIIWDKKHIGLGTYYRTQYEMVLFGVKGDRISIWNSGYDERDVWSMSREPSGNYVHPTQKPVEMVERAIINSSHKDDLILDLFGGSGTTLIASEKTNRVARIIELDVKYADVIVKRWQNFTGSKAINSSGRTIDNGM